MRRITVAVIIALLTTSSIAFAQDEDGRKNNERLGVRIGWSGTSSNVKDTFGDGVQLGVQFAQRIRNTFFVSVGVNMNSLGRTERQDLTDQFFFPFFPPDDVKLRLLSVKLAPMFVIPSGDKWEFTVSGGVGFYTVSLLIEQGFTAGTITDNHFGINAGASVLRRLGTNWAIELGGEIHKFWTPSDDPGDIFFVYSEADEDPIFFNLFTGVTFNLF